MNGDSLSSARRIAYLIAGFIKNSLRPEERAELDDWIASSDDNMRLFGKLTDEHHIAKTKIWLDHLDENQALEKFSNAIKSKAPVRKILRYRVAAAGVMLVVTGAATFFFFNNKTPAPAELKKSVAVVQPVLPGSKKASLAINGNQVVDLSLNSSKTISIDDNSQVDNDFSVLTYHAGITSDQTHQLTTPRGGEYQVVLPDGTHVWLNAETSLTFPVTFALDNRTVQLSGEAYFEVTPDRKKPFNVVVNDRLKVLVLGTHFNINAYANSAGRVSLLEGKVSVTTNGQRSDMSPGQEVVVEKGRLAVNDNANVVSSIAWTKGKFSFDHTPVTEVLKQVSRWYDVEVNYNGSNDHLFTGEVFRNSSVDQVLRMLQLSTGEKFVIHKRTIIVQP
ncbi:MAG: FecR domain-containing protein [Chitinophagaceae bacterium]|nr:FecR domain-containing protein [Chitinophagaceae bacterium]